VTAPTPAASPREPATGPQHVTGLLGQGERTQDHERTTQTPSAGCRRGCVHLLRVGARVARSLEPILDRQQVDECGSKVIERLAAALWAKFPGTRGLSRSDLLYMRSFAGAWRAAAIV